MLHIPLKKSISATIRNVPTFNRKTLQAEAAVLAIGFDACEILTDSALQADEPYLLEFRFEKEVRRVRFALTKASKTIPAKESESPARQQNRYQCAVLDETYRLIQPELNHNTVQNEWYRLLYRLQLHNRNIASAVSQ